MTDLLTHSVRNGWPWPCGASTRGRQGGLRLQPLSQDEGQVYFQSCFNLKAK